MALTPRCQRQVPGKVPGEGHLRLRPLPGRESIGGPGSLLGSAVGPRGRISLGDQSVEGKEFISAGQGELLPGPETRGERGQVLLPEVLPHDCQSSCC